MKPTLPTRARYDLHLHSNRSDGACPPIEVLERCAKAGLNIVALTDHDLVNELAPGPHTLGSRTIHLIKGAEITGTHGGVEFHLLVYFPGEVPAGFRDFCDAQIEARLQRYDDAVRILGLPHLEQPDDDARSGRRSLTRHHLARALVSAGHAASMSDAFGRYANRTHVPLMDVPFTECIRVARAHGGITSWAHPPIGAVIELLPTFAAAGLHAVEALRPMVGSKTSRKLKKLAKRHKLFLTGGSDWHGWGSKQLGLFHVPGSDIRPFLDALAAA